MKQLHKYLRKPGLISLADYSGLLASCLCFIHCWAMPLLLIFLPGLVNYNDWVHPMLCSIAICSTLPMVLKKIYRLQTGLFQFALVLGNMIMLIILLTHDLLSFKAELLLNTIGGISLVYVHYKKLAIKKRLDQTTTS